MRKKFLYFLLMVLLIATLGGCSRLENPQTQTTHTETKPVTIMTTFYPIYISALNLAGGIPNVQVVNLTPSQTGCLHDYQLTPADMVHLESADYLVINGAGLESFLDNITKSYPNLPLIDASKDLELLIDPESQEINPHIWVSISGHKAQTESICRQLMALDPERASWYQKNCASYVEKVDALTQRMHEELDNLPQRDIITLHEAFPYFAQEFHLHIAAVVQRDPGSEPNAGEIAQTIELIKTKNVKIIFAEPQYSSKAAETIARESGSVLYILDPAVTGPEDPDAYLHIMENNLQVLKTALK